METFLIIYTALFLFKQTQYLVLDYLRIHVNILNRKVSHKSTVDFYVVISSKHDKDCVMVINPV